MIMKNFFKKSQWSLLPRQSQNQSGNISKLPRQRLTQMLTLILILLLASSAWAFKRFPDSEYGVPTAKNSGVKTADTAILAAAGIFYGILVVTDGSNACTISVYDNASAASGTKLFPTVIVPAGSTSGYGISMGYGVLAANGIYTDITTSGTCSFSVYYDY